MTGLDLLHHYLAHAEAARRLEGASYAVRTRALRALTDRFFRFVPESRAPAPSSSPYATAADRSALPPDGHGPDHSTPVSERSDDPTTHKE